MSSCKCKELEEANKHLSEEVIIFEGSAHPATKWTADYVKRLEERLSDLEKLQKTIWDMIIPGEMDSVEAGKEILKDNHRLHKAFEDLSLETFLYTTRIKILREAMEIVKAESKWFTEGDAINRFKRINAEASTALEKTDGLRNSQN